MANWLAKWFKKIIPAPFTIAVILTFFTFLLAYIFDTNNSEKPIASLFLYWEEGLWNQPLIVFAFQMMLMLVLGHVVALSEMVNRLIEKLSSLIHNTAQAAAIVTFLTLIVSLFNWGLGLIFGAIFARKIGEYAVKKDIKLAYPLIGAAGYSGLMVWHGGISGSAPIKIAEKGHFMQEKIGIISQNATIFSTMNITISIALLIILPLLMYYLGSKAKGIKLTLKQELIEQHSNSFSGAEKLDHSNWIGVIFGCIIIGFSFYKAVILPEKFDLSFITPNFINLFLFGSALLVHKNFYQFLRAISKSINGASGILIQFPLYFGIMGLMKSSGMVSMISDFFVNVSNPTTFPIFTFLSAGIVNIFVPSGGGQWAIQGPIVIEAAQQIGVPYWKTIMALAYGDQTTNMLQPFWALPLLAITGLKAKEILPYTLILMLVGSTIFILGLLIF